MNTPKLILIALASFASVITGCSKKSLDPVPGPPPEEQKPVNLLSSIAPAKGLPNSAVKITGTNFSTDKSKLTVNFNGINATIYTASATELVVEVPPTAKTGKIKVISDGVTWTSTSDFSVTNATQSTWEPVNTMCATVDKFGNIYASHQKTIYKGSTSTSGVMTTLVNSTTAFGNLYGIVTDSSGNLFVVDRDRREIFKITPAGVVTSFAGGPSGTMTWDGQGAAAKFLSPNGITIDASDNLYVADGVRIRKITPGGLVTTIAGTGSDGMIDGDVSVARFGYLVGIALAPNGDIYVTDNSYQNIRKLTPSGKVSTFAGTNVRGFLDGPLATALFSYPKGIAIDKAGNIFIADYDFPTYSGIRMINTAGYVSTFLSGTNAPVINGSIVSATTRSADAIAFDAKGDLYICNTGVLSKVSFN